MIVTTFTTFWPVIREIISCAGNICIFLITSYTFYLTLWPKPLKLVDVQFRMSSFKGNSFTFSLENRSLSTQVVRSVDMIVDSCVINLFKGYRHIDSFDIASFEMAPYSYLISDKGERIKDSDYFGDKISLRIVTSRSRAYIVKPKRMSSIQCYLYKKNMEKYSQGGAVRNTLNDQIIVPGVEYALILTGKNNQKKTVFIHDSGLLSDSTLGFNAIPEELVNDERQMMIFFGKKCREMDLECKLVKLELFDNISMQMEV